jgi:uncharacterized membrane protein YhaH (DUF805 family)
MTCSVCGRVLADSATRCASCGARTATAEPRDGFAYTPDAGNAAREPKPDGAFDWYLRSFSKYADFDGRATRSEYWWFILMNVVVSAAILFVGILVKVPWLYLVYSVAALIPSFAVTIRRLHDTGRSGWWWFIGFLPVLGAIILLIFTLQDTEPRTNAYGPNPKEQWS